MCSIKESCLTWCLLFLILVLVDIRSVAILQKDAKNLRCFSCDSRMNSTLGVENCKETHKLPAVRCPGDKPYCMTASIVPFSRYTMSCSQDGSSESPCAASNTTGKLQISCMCSTELCNTPFTKQFKDILQKYTHFYINNTNQLETLSTFMKNNNISETKDVFEMAKVTNKSTTSHQKGSFEKPIKAEALKDSTMDDDDDDEVEGSGSFEDHKMKKPSQSPASPSSYLPSENNSGLVSLTVKLGVFILIGHIAI